MDKFEQERNQLLSKIKDLEQQLEVARKDADRYRWLRSKTSAHGIIDGWKFAFPTEITLPAPVIAMREPLTGLDAAIDAAIRQIGGAE